MGKKGENVVEKGGERAFSEPIPVVSEADLRELLAVRGEAVEQVAHGQPDVEGGCEGRGRE